MDRLIGDVPILIAEAVAIQKALRMASYLNMDNLLMESDSYIVINSIAGRNMIINLIADIVRLARTFRNI